ncbi:hypothetical protein C6P40_004077 [Pichia californica]|uniref:Nitrogen regulatory protein areA GATA-like domain-containing protein n=1 Tax=Pichia californica TaxID=460514 RepID=A0A9P6WFX6_9ASCO|nr:hypothetical protein C6P40_004077 [[Candida] californica]
MSKEVFNEGPTTSQHIESTDDDHFKTTTFKLKRTRSMGLLLDNSNILFNNSNIDNNNNDNDNNNDNNNNIPYLASSSSSSASNSNSNSNLNSNSASSSSNSNNLSSSTLGRTQYSKLTSGTYIPEETLSKLNLKSPNHHHHNHHHNHTQQQSQNLFRSNIINKKLENSPQSFQSDYFSDDLYNSEDSLSSPGSSIHNMNSSSYSTNLIPNNAISNNANANNSTNNSTNNNNNICLIPKHQQKRYNQLHNNANNNSNNNDSIHSDGINNNNNNSNSNSPPQENVDMTNILHDDIDVKDSPNEHVDYLTHKWEEDEISKSWKYVILRRKNVADSARLENASWRTWAQTRLNLKTISPEELNWSKDSDVTWLYGPVIKSSNTNNSNSTSNSNSNSPTIQPVISNKQSIDSIESDSLNSNPNSIKLSRNLSLENDSSLIYNDSNNNSNNISNNTIINSINNSNNNNDDNNNTNNSNTNNSLLSIDNNPPCDNLKSILKKKSKIEKMISDASYCRLQNLLEHREQKLKIQSDNQNSTSSSPLLEPSSNSISSLPSNTTITNESPYNNQNHLNSLSNSNNNSNNNSTTTLNLNSINSSILPNSKSKIKSSLKNSVLHIQQNSLINSSLNSDSNQIQNEKKVKHIHFNMRVDQCIALDTIDQNNEKLTNNDNHDHNYDYDYDDDDYVNTSEESDDYPISNMVSSNYREDHDHYADDESDYKSKSRSNSTMMYDDSKNSSSDSSSDSEDDEGFVLAPTINNSNISHKPKKFNNINNNNNKIKKLNFKNSKNNLLTTIAPLPSTTLKFGSDDEYEYNSNNNNYNNNNSNYYNNHNTISHNTKTNRGYDYYYDYNSVYSNNSNPMIYSSNNNVSQDVQMYDVPQNCQIEDSMDLDDDVDNNNNNNDDDDDEDDNKEQQNQKIDNQNDDKLKQSILTPDLIVNSPFLISHYSISNTSSVNASPLLLPSNNNNNNNHNNNIVDVPESFIYNIPKFDDEINDNNNEKYSKHIERSELIDNNELKRTSSIGLSSSMSSIKVGLSGLDLNTSGLRRSTGAGSKPQLFHLNNNNNNNSNNNSNSGVSLIGLNRTNSSSSNSRNKFLFAESSESESENENESDVGSDILMVDNDEIDNNKLNFNSNFDHEGDDEMIEDNINTNSNNEKIQTDLLNAVKSASFNGKLGSLADINRKFGELGNINRNNNNNLNINNSNKISNSTFNFQNDSESESE